MMPSIPAGHVVQSLVFPRSHFSPSDGRAWAKKHGYSAAKVDVKPNTFRIRQRDPNTVDSRSYRTLRQGKVQIVVARPLARKNPGPARARRRKRGRTPCAGLALVRAEDGRMPELLLVEERGSGKLGIPKGRLDAGEQHRQAAIREVGEEVGVHVQRGRIHSPGRVCSMRFWCVDVGLDELPDELPRDWLQSEEVAWAGFVPLDEAEELIEEWQLPVLDHIARTC
jgi:8-oxo-dGTP pyrophosphatase MutT (NUDIX family)